MCIKLINQVLQKVAVMMSIKTRQIDCKTIVEIPCTTINLDNIKDFSDEVYEIIRQTQGNVVLDLGHVESIDSRALGFIVSLHKRCIYEGSKLSLLSVRPSVMYLLTITRFDSILDIYNDENQFMEVVKTSA